MTDTNKRMILPALLVLGMGYAFYQCDWRGSGGDNAVGWHLCTPYTASQATTYAWTVGVYYQDKGPWWADAKDYRSECVPCLGTTDAAYWACMELDAKFRKQAEDSNARLDKFRKENEERMERQFQTPTPKSETPHRKTKVRVS